MGIDLLIRMSDEDSPSIDISRFFHRSVLHGSSASFDFNGVLNKKEQELVTPNESGYAIVGSKNPGCLRGVKMFRLMQANVEATSFEDPFEHMVEYSEKIEHRERDPSEIKIALTKLREHIRLNPDKFPLWHKVYRNQEDDELDVAIRENEPIYEDQQTSVFVRGSMVYEDEYPQVRQKIKLLTYARDEPRTLTKSEYIDVTPSMTIKGVPVLTRSLTMYDMCKSDFEIIFALLEEAIAKDKKILLEHI